MIFARSARLSAIAVVVVLLAGASAATAPAATADRLQLRFEIFGFAGFHVLTNRTTVEEAAGHYRIKMDLDTRGLASIFVNLISHSDVHGGLDGGIPQPAAYSSDVRRNGVDRHYRVDYGADGAVINASTPPPSGQLLPVTAEQIRGTVDQMTAYFRLERQLSERGTCNLVVRVFDGSGLYNLRFTNFKREQLSPDGYQNFTGPVQVCKVTREDRVVNPDASSNTYREGMIWYASVIAGSQMVPVRMEYDTAFGAVKGYLTELRGPGVDLNLMRN
jgi:Protein of unknown function (DUF3108)